MHVEMGLVLGEDFAQVAFVHDEDPVEEFTAYAAHPPFHETGLRAASRLRWVHSASTGKYVLITVHDKRGIEAMNAAGVLSAFAGIAVHDGWSPYDAYDKATHAR
jgi:phosphoglycerate dehydrogenase-like enzyme